MAVARKIVLIVEDEPLIAMMMEDTVRDLGFAPRVSGDVAEAVQLVEAGDIDLAILDHRLRTGDSEPVALELQKRSIPFILCTGTTQANLAPVFQGVAAVNKPYRDEELAAAIQAVFQ